MVKKQKADTPKTTELKFTKNEIPELELGFVKLRKDAVIPVKDYPGDAAYPIITLDAIRILPGDHKVFRTGLAPKLEAGWHYELYSRSGMGFNNGIELSNSVGIIDSNFTGEIKISLHNAGRGIYSVAAGDKIAQIMLVKEEPEADNLKEYELVNSTDRGTDGFGSTGR